MKNPSSTGYLWWLRQSAPSPYWQISWPQHLALDAFVGEQPGHFLLGLCIALHGNDQLPVRRILDAADRALQNAQIPPKPTTDSAKHRLRGGRAARAQAYQHTAYALRHIAPAFRVDAAFRQQRLREIGRA